MKASRQMKSAARLYAVQALFQMEASGQSADSVQKEFETHRFGAVYDDEEMAEGDVDLFRKLVGDAVNWQGRIDQMTDRALVAKWPIDRIDPTLRALFRAAGAELTVKENVCLEGPIFPGGQRPNADYRAIPGTILLDAARTIRVQRGATLRRAR